MELLSVIRRWALRDQLSIREIARRTGLSRNTIRKYLRSGRRGAEVQGSGAAEQAGRFCREAVGLAEDGGRPAAQAEADVKQLHADLVALGFDGSYGRVAAFAREWREDRQREQQTAGRGTFVPLAFQPGEAFQFDWSEDWAVIGGERVKLQAAHIKLCYSRAFLVRAYPLQTHEMLFDAHYHAFRVLRRRAAARHLRQHAHGGGSGWSARSARSTRVFRHGRATISLIRIFAIRPRAGRRGRSRRTSRMRATGCGNRCRAFATLAELNDWLEQRCQALWREIPHGSQPGIDIRCMGERGAEPDALARPFDGFVECSKRVSPTCLVHFDRNRYSVPASFANRRSACGSIRTGLSWSRKGSHLRTQRGSSSGHIICPAAPSMIGATTWR